MPRALKIVLTLLIFYVLFVFRFHDYGRYPWAGQADELNYGWAGISLIRDGSPVGWSYHPSYRKSWVVFDGVVDPADQIKVGGKFVRPWLDEPPLYSVLAGGVAHLYGVNTFSVLPASYIRLPAVIFGFATTIVLFLWAWLWYGWSIGLLVAAIFTFTPIFNFSSRLSLPENGISFLFVSSLFIYLLFRKYPRPIFISLIAILIGLAGLMKPTGFFIIFLITFFLLRQRQYRLILLAWFNLLPFVGYFLYYGYHLGGPQFWTILVNQGFRPTGWTSLAFILSTPIYNTNAQTLYDGWYVFLFVASIYTAISSWSNPKIRFLATAIFFWLSVIIVSSGEQDALAWYRYPLFPLLAFLGTLALVKFIKRPRLFSNFLIVSLLLSSRFYIHNAHLPTTSSTVFKSMFIFLLSPTLLYQLYPHALLRRLQQLFLIGIVIVGLYFNMKYIYSAFELSCDGALCPIQVETSLSRTRLPFFWRFFINPRFLIYLK